MTAFRRPSAHSRETRISIGFLNLAHAPDHYVLLIYPTVVIGLEAVYARTYGELIALSTRPSSAFGVFSLPAGWLGDHWSRRNMMALFWFGCGVSLFAAGLAPNLVALAIALGALGMFAAIYHPVGMSMLIEASNARGRTLAFNGVCGNHGSGAGGRHHRPDRELSRLARGVLHSRRRLHRHRLCLSLVGGERHCTGVARARPVLTCA